jgi:hypothetical protein
VSILVPGDSGAWVYSPTNRQLCGHVLAWGDKSKTAYIAPMEVLFEDIKETLGAETVCLPGGEDLGVLASSKKDFSRQLQNSRDIEATLRRMALGDGEMQSNQIAPPLTKDVASVQQRSMENQSPGIVQVVI